MSVSEIPVTDAFFPGFRQFDINTAEAIIRCRIGGSGPPLLLLHGSPQTHIMWYKVAPLLQPYFTIIVADLRGYGDSSKPATTSDHTPYSKRAMAQDMVTMMASLGFSSFFLAGHDRGGRVAHRLVLDHPSHVHKVALLDIAPTREMYAGTTDAFARAYWHWFFLIQNAPLPEQMILSNVDAYISRNRPKRAPDDPLYTSAMAEYLRCFQNPATVHACCEDYRAAATIDIAHDNADGDKLVEAPLLVLWGALGVVERCFDVMALWQKRARIVEGKRILAGHHLAEETPREVAAALKQFFE